MYIAIETFIVVLIYPFHDILMKMTIKTPLIVRDT